MSVFIVTTETFPNGMAATARIRCYAKAIAFYEKCTVLIANRLEDSDNPLGNILTSGSLNGYSYKYLGRSTAKSKNPFLQKLNQIHDVICLLLYLLRNLRRKDSILFYSYDLILGKIISRIAHLKGAFIFFELCEHPRYQCKGYPKDNREEKQLYWVRSRLKYYDGFFVISHALVNYIEKCFDKKKRTLHIPILFENPLEDIGKVACDGIPYLLHTGALSQRKDGIINSLKAFGEYINRYKGNLNYYLTGDLKNSPDRSKILNVIEQYGIASRVCFLGYLSTEDIWKYQRGAFLTIINKEDNLQNNYCFATKIAEYLNAGCLLVTTDVGEVRYYLRNGDNCLFFNYDDINGLSNLINYVYENREIRDQIAKRGKETAMKYFYCLNYSETIIKFIKSQ